MITYLPYMYGALGLVALKKIVTRLQLSKAKHPSLRGHSRISRRLAKWLPYFEYVDDDFFLSDNASADIGLKRRKGFEKLCAHFSRTCPHSIELSEELSEHLSDYQLTHAYRVPFPYRRYVNDHLSISSVATASRGTEVQDADGNWQQDIYGSYGVNVFGYDFYKSCVDEGIELTKELGPVLGLLHPLVIDNAKKIKEISGLDEVSFHMSGTEAVMQAVRLARYHTGKSHVVRFCGAYHGWWDGVQPGVGGIRKERDIYTLKDNDEDTLKVLRTRKDIACVLVNPLQALHPNSNPPSDASLVNSAWRSQFNRENYTQWLKELRDVCTQRGIVLIMDEIFMGFRLAARGAQEYFNIQADMVTYGKTLGGGLPVGVVCGKREFMKRFKEDKPTHLCFARGTFNSHPYVMGAMNVFLKRMESDDIQKLYRHNDQTWEQRVKELNQAFKDNNIPIEMSHMSSVVTCQYTIASRYNWMYQFYCRAEGLALNWTGVSRLIFSHNHDNASFKTVIEKLVKAGLKMKKDAWWHSPPELSNKSIKKMMLRRTLSALFNK